MPEITMKSALKTVLELAEQNALDIGIVECKEEELVNESKFQLECLEMTAQFINNWPWESEDIFEEPINSKESKELADPKERWMG